MAATHASQSESSNLLANVVDDGGVVQDGDAGGEPADEALASSTAHGLPSEARELLDDIMSDGAPGSEVEVDDVRRHPWWGPPSAEELQLRELERSEVGNVQYNGLGGGHLYCGRPSNYDRQCAAPQPFGNCFRGEPNDVLVLRFARHALRDPDWIRLVRNAFSTRAAVCWCRPFHSRETSCHGAVVIRTSRASLSELRRLRRWAQASFDALPRAEQESEVALWEAYRAEHRPRPSTDATAAGSGEAGGATPVRRVVWRADVQDNKGSSAEYRALHKARAPAGQPPPLLGVRCDETAEHDAGEPVQMADATLADLCGPAAGGSGGGHSVLSKRRRDDGGSAAGGRAAGDGVVKEAGSRGLADDNGAQADSATTIDGEETAEETEAAADGAASSSNRRGSSSSKRKKRKNKKTGDQRSVAQRAVAD